MFDFTKNLRQAIRAALAGAAFAVVANAASALTINFDQYITGTNLGQVTLATLDATQNGNNVDFVFTNTGIAGGASAFDTALGMMYNGSTAGISLVVYRRREALRALQQNATGNGIGGPWDLVVNWGTATTRIVARAPEHWRIQQLHAARGAVGQPVLRFGQQPFCDHPRSGADGRRVHEIRPEHPGACAASCRRPDAFGRVWWTWVGAPPPQERLRQPDITMEKGRPLGAALFPWPSSALCRPFQPCLRRRRAPSAPNPPSSSRPAAGTGTGAMV